ncbi:MAG: 23S rRNA (guanosine(2251)-2'-O)-methyltransferase RlmB [bacterium]|nr:23S rRNA (guanosine(2251)-2'-O)-methyltransferase RlmB [bacterium]MBK8128483.1 23S rRNA (guanosine(2251)-2'-O)-methyltransferase RlmB [bacterium]
MSPRRPPPRPFDRSAYYSPDRPLQIYGRKPILEALRRGLVEELTIAPNAHGQVIDDIRALASRLRVPLSSGAVESQDMDSPSQGVCANIRKPDISSDVHDLDDLVSQKPAPLVLMLDGIEDPRNFGAILRSAYAAGADAVIFRSRRQAPITDTVFKTSAGGAALVNLFEVTNLDQTVRTLKESGWWIVAAAAEEHSRVYSEFDWDRPTVLILGAEGPGVSSLLLKRADLTVKIPLYRDFDSLNVSAAAAVLLFEAAKARQLEPKV